MIKRASAITFAVRAHARAMVPPLLLPRAPLLLTRTQIMHANRSQCEEDLKRRGLWSKVNVEKWCVSAGRLKHNKPPLYEMKEALRRELAKEAGTRRNAGARLSHTSSPRRHVSHKAAKKARQDVVVIDVDALYADALNTEANAAAQEEAKAQAEEKAQAEAGGEAREEAGGVAQGGSGEEGKGEADAEGVPVTPDFNLMANTPSTAPSIEKIAMDEWPPHPESSNSTPNVDAPAAIIENLAFELNEMVASDVHVDWDFVNGCGMPMGIDTEPFNTVKKIVDTTTDEEKVAKVLASKRSSGRKACVSAAEYADNFLEELGKDGFLQQLARSLSKRAYPGAFLREYSRFMGLRAAGGTCFVASEAVQIVWTKHREFGAGIYKKHCTEVFGTQNLEAGARNLEAEAKTLHASGLGDLATSDDAARYAATLAAYRASFGEEPDPALWPPFPKETSCIVKGDAFQGSVLVEGVRSTTKIGQILKAVTSASGCNLAADEQILDNDRDMAFYGFLNDTDDSTIFTPEFAVVTLVKRF